MTGDVDRAGRIAFRPLATADVPSIQRWLTEPGVAAWWREPDLGLEAIARKYTPLVDGTDPAGGFVIVIEGDPAGFIQAYRIGDFPTTTAPPARHAEATVPLPRMGGDFAALQGDGMGTVFGEMAPARPQPS